MVPIAINAAFKHVAIPDHPPGFSIATFIRVGLLARDWRASAIENWRDCGWNFQCGKDEQILELVLLQWGGESSWFLHIGSAYSPGLFGWMIGRKASAKTPDLYANARDVHTIISSNDRYTHIMWRWDDMPEPESFTAEPMSWTET